MSENLREGIAAHLSTVNWSNASTRMDRARFWRERADAVLAVVGPELDRLRAEVETRDTYIAMVDAEFEKIGMRSRGTVAVPELAARAIAAEAERADLRERLAKVEALADEADDLRSRGWPGNIGPSDLRAALASVPEPSDSEPAPCRCHDTHAAITARHEGHCCFYPADRKCHPTEVEAWTAAHRALTEPAPCGHVERVTGCGGCDPGAVEWVRDDGATHWRRPTADETTLPGVPAPDADRGAGER